MVLLKPEPKKLTKQQEIIQDSWNIRVSPESSSEDVKKLQNLFRELDLYNGAINWEYTSVEKPLIDFQIQAWIVKDKEGWWAGYYWDQTRSALFEYFEAEEVETNVQEKREEEITYSLSLKETRDLDKLISRLRTKVNAIAKKKNKKSEDIMEQLSNRIDTVINKTEEGKLKEKLKYIKQKIS